MRGLRIAQNRPLVAVVTGAAIGLTSILVWRGADERRVAVDGTIVLTGGSCATHRTQCAKLAQHGSVIVFAGSLKQSAPLHGRSTRVHFDLRPGVYTLAFPLDSLGATSAVLQPDLDRAGVQPGSFRVEKDPVRLGIVRPSTNWVTSAE